jgi:NIPSNAP
LLARVEDDARAGQLSLDADWRLVVDEPAVDHGLTVGIGEDRVAEDLNGMQGGRAHGREIAMIVDVRTYTRVPRGLGAWLALYEAEGMPIHVRHLGQPIGVFTTDVGTVNQVVFFWGFGSQADRERRRDELEADPDWVSYRKKSAEAGNVQHQESKIIKSTKFSPM